VAGGQGFNVVGCWLVVVECPAGDTEDVEAAVEGTFYFVAAKDPDFVMGFVDGGDTASLERV